VKNQQNQQDSSQNQRSKWHWENEKEDITFQSSTTVDINPNENQISIYVGSGRSENSTTHVTKIQERYHQKYRKCSNKTLIELLKICTYLYKIYNIE